MMRFNFLLSSVLDASNISEIYGLLDVTASSYWDTHYKPGTVSMKRVKKLGDSMKNVIIINALIPFLFVYGKERGEERYCDKALQWLEELKAERNHVSEAWTRYGVKVNSALQSQALLQVKREYCDTHRCLHCKIGAEIFRRVGRD